MRRREWLSAVAGTAITLRARGGLASFAPEPAPKTVTQALDRIQTLMSPEALAALFVASEKELLEFEIGIEQLMELYWQKGAYNEPPPSLASALAARGVARNDTAAYLLTSLWRRRKGLPLDRDSQLRGLYEYRRWEEETIARIQRERRIAIHHRGNRTITFLQQPAYFRRGTAELEPGQETWVEALAATIRAYPSMLLLEAQGHAAMHESHPDELSLSRARSVRSGLQQNGVQPSRLSAYGLGSRYQLQDPLWCPPICRGYNELLPSAPGRDRRVDLVILRRELWRPEPTPAARDGGVGGR